MALQIFGTPRCQDTKKAWRFFKERDIAFQAIDLSEKGLSPGELRSLSAALGLETLADKDGKRWKEKGLDHLVFDLEETLLEDPLLLKTPIVRDGPRASLGFDQRAWAVFATEAKTVAKKRP